MGGVSYLFFLHDYNKTISQTGIQIPYGAHKMIS